jgi:hypothetical protein
MSKVRLIPAVALQLVLVCAAALAQSSSITGRVVDPQGAGVANAEITLSTVGQAGSLIRLQS